MRSCRALFMHQTIYATTRCSVRWQAHRYMLAPEPQLLPQRVRRPRLAEGHADRRSPCATRCSKLIDVFVYVVVYFGGTLYPVRRTRRWADRAARRLARRLCRHPRVPRAAGQKPLGGGAGGAFAPDDRPHRRQLHQHPDHKALRPYASASRTMPATRWTSSWITSAYRQMRLVTGNLVMPAHVINRLLLAAVAGSPSMPGSRRR